MTSSLRETYKVRPWPALVVLVGLALLVAGVGGAQTCPAVAGIEGFGSANQVARSLVVSNGFAYSADAFGFTVYDVSGSDRPEQVGQLMLSGPGVDVAVDGDLAYVVDETGWLTVIDVSNRWDPVVLSSLMIPGDPRGMAFDPEAHMLYVIRHVYMFEQPADSIRVVDVTDPAHPEGRSWIDGYRVYSIYDVVVVASGVLYASNWRQGVLEVFDVTDPDDPRSIMSIEIACRSMVTAGGVLYGAGRQGLVVLDVSDPRTPRVLSQIGGLEYRNTLLDGGTLLATTNEGVEVLDLANQAQPRSVATVRIAGADVIAGAGGLVVVQSDRGPLHLVDVTDSALPELRGHLDVGGNARTILADGDLLYVADGLSLEVLDVSDPEHPARRGRLRTSAGIDLVARWRSRLYLVDSSGYLDIVDVSDPDSPRLAGLRRLEQPPYGIAVSGLGDHVYLGEGNRLEILDVSNPVFPTQVASRPMQAEDLVIDGTTLYVTCWRQVGESLLATYDISDPGAPALVRSRSLPQMLVMGVLPVGDLLLVRDNWSEGFYVFDSELDMVGLVWLPFSAGAMEVQGTMAVVAASTRDHPSFAEGLAFVDLADPRKPEVAALVRAQRLENDIAIARPSSTVWTALGALVEGVWADCTSCAGMRISTSTRQLVIGDRATVTVAVVDLAGTPAPGQQVTGTATTGVVGVFTDRGDGSYTATYTAGTSPAHVEIAVSVNGAKCSRTVQIDVHRGILHLREHPVSAEIGRAESSLQ